MVRFQNKKFILRPRVGFTLVEAMVSVAVFSLMLLALHGLLGTSTRVYQIDTTYLDLHQQARQAMTRLVRDVRASRSSLITLGVGSGTGQRASLENSGNDQLFFSTERETGIKYYLDGEKLVREYPVGDKVIVAVNISRLKFSKTGAQLTIDMRAEKPCGRQACAFPLVETVRLRNE